MSPVLRRLAPIAGAAIALTFATASVAQPAPPPPGVQAGPAAKRGPGMRMHRQYDPAARAQRLRDTLQLRPEQDRALQDFLAATAPDPARMQERRERRDAGPLTTPQRLDRQAARMAERQANFARHADAVKRFYAQLTPAQQRAFDAMHPGKGRKGGKMGRHPGGRG